MLEGSITLIRPLADHWIWTSEKFTKGQAWVDLILLANDGPASINKDGQIVQLDRGDVGWSLSRLATRWGWVNDKGQPKATNVSFWFKKLCREGMLTKKGAGKTAIFGIVNYDQFNPPEDPDCTTVASPLHDDCTTIASEREREKEEEHHPRELASPSSGAVAVPSEDEFLAHTRSYPGFMANGIPAGIPDGWALDCFSWMMDEADRGKPWPKNWRSSVHRRFRADWIKGRQSARNSGGGTDPAKTAPWKLKREAAELREQIDCHPANPRGVGYAGEFCEEKHRTELAGLRKRLQAIEKEMERAIAEEGGNA